MPRLTVRRKRLFLALVLCWLSNVGHTAIQGTSGPTSAGDIDVNLIMGLNVRISGLADLALGTWSGSGDLTGNDNLCIGRTGVVFFGAGPYRILAQGDGAPGDPSAFTLSNGATMLTYEVYFNDQTGLSGRTQLTPGLALTGQAGFGLGMVFNMFGCVFQNANISVIVREAELSSSAGTYAGILNLILIPE